MSVPDARRRLPQVDRLVREIDESVYAGLPHAIATDAARTVVEAARRRARRTGEIPSHDEIVAMTHDEIRRRRRTLLSGVVNATGVVLHTNLGRAPLPAVAIEAIERVAAGYSNLEFDTETGRRGDRYVHVEPMIALVTGAEAALIVNNNAAAVLLVCAALASGREVVISRGELIEIGGEFRIPDVLAQSGAILREVGTTNRTHLRDYERAVHPDTAMVLKVHPSNYRVVGFTQSPSVGDLAEVAKAARVPLVYDVGSGLLTLAHGVHFPVGDEPAVTQALNDGADLVCFSGDKLLGGPQAGIVCGSAALVERLRTHPLLRALRPDKLQLAALGATVAAHLDGRVLDIPLWRMIATPYEELERRSRSLRRRLSSSRFECEVVPGESVAGGGSLPGQTIPSPVVRLRHPAIRTNALVEALRAADPPIVVRVEDGYAICDLRTVLPEQDAGLVRALRAIDASAGA